MGRKAGHLTLGIGKAAGATISVIAEEFPEGSLSVDQVCDVLEGAIIKRRAADHADGVALVAEGISERLNPQELAKIPGVEFTYDPHGHLELREIPLAMVLKRHLEQRFAARNDKVTIVDIELGYEMRCAPPIPFDCEYVRDLGWAAVTHLLSPEYAGDAMVCLDGGHLRPLPFAEVLDPVTRRANVRLVDITSESYRVALEYMIRLKPEDLEDASRLARLAKTARMSEEAFRERFAVAAHQPEA
jgi:6-phosphofructokinase 1